MSVSARGEWRTGEGEREHEGEGVGKREQERGTGSHTAQRSLPRSLGLRERSLEGRKVGGEREEGKER